MHLMVDLETLDKTPTSAFFQIGWGLFDPRGSGMTDGGCIFVDAQTCIDAGLTISWDTIQWWMRQDDNARKLLQQKGAPLAEALSELTKATLGKINGVWSHGATFDIPILNHAYSRVGLIPPWTHKECYDTRTLFLLKKPTWPKNKVLHSALDDVKTQIGAVQSLACLFP